MSTHSDYLPVDSDFVKAVQALEKAVGKAKIFFFTGAGGIDSVTGRVAKVRDTGREASCVVADKTVRLDRIITLNGRPGPAYDDYDAYANACLNCNQDI